MASVVTPTAAGKAAGETNGKGDNGAPPEVVGVSTGSVRDVCPMPRQRNTSPGPVPVDEPVSFNVPAQADDEDSVSGMPEALTQQETVWAFVLVASSAVDMVASAIIAFNAFSYAYRDDGVSMYCLGIQACSHFLSSVAAIMRFMFELLPAREGSDHAVSDDSLLLEQRRRDLGREQAVAITVSLTMLLSSAGLLFKAFRKIRFWDVWYLDHANQDAELERVTDLMAWWGFALYLVQGVLRFLAARKLRRSIVWHVFVVSVISLIFFCALGVAASYEREWSWKAEPLVAIFLVFVMLVEAIRMIIQNLGDVDTVLRHESRA